MTEPLLSIRDLHTLIDAPSRLEPPVRAVDGVDLDIGPRETLCLVGESGCGKTMLALSIGRLLPPRARIVRGQVAFQGRKLTSLSERQLRAIRGRGIAYVFQDPFAALNPVMSIGEQLSESIRLYESVSTKAASRKAALLLKQVQIPLPEERLRQYPHQLSGGMRQRVLIAMALSGRPALLIADEPTTALDVTTQSEILSLLRQLKSSLGMSILLITHDLMAVAPFSDRLAVMVAGRIVEVAETAKLYRNPSHPYTQALLKSIPKVGQGKQNLQWNRF